MPSTLDTSLSENPRIILSGEDVRIFLTAKSLRAELEVHLMIRMEEEGNIPYFAGLIELSGRRDSEICADVTHVYPCASGISIEDINVDVSLPLERLLELRHRPNVANALIAEAVIRFLAGNFTASATVERHQDFILVKVEFRRTGIVHHLLTATIPYEDAQKLVMLDDEELCFES